MKFEGKVRSAILSTHACHPYFLLEGEPMSLWVVGNPRASCGRRWGGKSASASCFTILIPHSAGLQEIHLGALRAYNKKLLML